MDDSDISAAYFIQLGPHGAWVERCIAEGVIELGLQGASHAAAQRTDWERVRQELCEAGCTTDEAASGAMQLALFYRSDARLWLTIAHNQLWWAIARPEVLPVLTLGRGARLRRLADGWRSHDASGRIIEIADLSCGLLLDMCMAAPVQSLTHSSEAIALTLGAASPDTSRLGASTANAGIGSDWPSLVSLTLTRNGWRRCAAGQAPCGACISVFERHAPNERLLVLSSALVGGWLRADLLQRIRERWPERLLLALPPEPPPTSIRCDPRIMIWDEARLAREAAMVGLPTGDEAR